MHYTRYTKLKINVTHLSPECRGAVTPRGGAGRHRGGNMRGAQAAHFIIFRELGAVLMYVLTRKPMAWKRIGVRCMAYGMDWMDKAIPSIQIIRIDTPYLCPQSRYYFDSRYYSPKWFILGATCIKYRRTLIL